MKQIHEIVQRECPTGSLCDPFGGIGIVGSFFKRHGYAVTTGDHLLHAHYSQVARVQRDQTPSFRRLRESLGLPTARSVVDELNRQRSPASSWLVRHYAIQRRFFTPDNARRIAGCRNAIHRWRRNGLLSTQETAVLLASLVDSMDRVANTAGTYYAYLKTWYRKSLYPFRFDLIRPTRGKSRCRSLLGDARSIVSERHFDVLYLDPPHNIRRYSGYYHLPETICRAGGSTNSRDGRNPRPTWNPIGLQQSTHGIRRTLYAPPDILVPLPHISLRRRRIDVTLPDSPTVVDSRRIEGNSHINARLYLHISFQTSRAALVLCHQCLAYSRRGTPPP